jgi:hypothetical protein
MGQTKIVSLKKDVTVVAPKLIEAIHGSVEDLDDLELAVNAGQQATDAASHRLIAEVHDHGDRRKNQRILGHGLSLVPFTSAYKSLRYEVQSIPSRPFRVCSSA